MVDVPNGDTDEDEDDGGILGAIGRFFGGIADAIVGFFDWMIGGICDFFGGLFGIIKPNATSKPQVS